MATTQPLPDTTNTLDGRITATMFALAGIPSVSGAEAAVRGYLRDRLLARGLTPTEDAAGNLIARVAGVPAERDHEPPLLLNAHMDRVPPGLAHTPLLADGILRSDGATNLGADDSAGLAIILRTVDELQARGQAHPPLLLVFTTGEEVGLTGARAFDPTPWGAREGFVYDNVDEPGVVVIRAAHYIAFDALLTGHGGHPGKQLDGTASAIEIFRRARYPFGVLDEGATRVSIGRIEGGTMRNAVPRAVRVLGEVRTLLDGEAQAALLQRIERAFHEAAAEVGGEASLTFDTHCAGYTVAEDEPLVRAYAATLARRGQALRPVTTFIGSDASALRPEVRVITVSTGAMDEHTIQEWIALAPLTELVETALDLLGAYHTS